MSGGVSGGPGWVMSSPQSVIKFQIMRRLSCCSQTAAIHKTIIFLSGIRWEENTKMLVACVRGITCQSTSGAVGLPEQIRVSEFFFFKKDRWTGYTGSARVTGLVMPRTEPGCRSLIYISCLTSD